MKNHLVSDSNCNNCKSTILQIFLQGTTNNVGLTFIIGDTTLWLQLLLSKTIRIRTINIIFSLFFWVEYQISEIFDGNLMDVFHEFLKLLLGVF